MLNHIVIMGRLTRDPELHRTQNDTSVTTITVAVDRNYQQDGERQTDFFNVVAWGPQADFVCKYLAKGRMIVVEGSMESSKWQDKDGNNQISWRIHADKIYFADAPKSGQDEENKPIDADGGQA